MGNISSLIPGARLGTQLQQEQSMHEASYYRMGLSDITMLYLSFCRPKYKRVNRERTLPILPSEIVFEIFSLAGLTSCISQVSRSDLREGTNDENRLDLSLCILKSGKLKLSNLGDNFSDVDLSLLSRFLIQLCRISVDVTSKDQGWSSYRVEQGLRSSHTWVEVAVQAKYIQPASETNPEKHTCSSCGGSHSGGANTQVDPPRHQTLSSSRWLAWRNIHAGQTWESQEVHFRRDSDICNYVNQLLEAQVQGTPLSMIEADTKDALISPESHLTDLRVELWARSRYPGWRCFLRHTCLTLEWKISGPGFWLNADTRAF